MLHFTPNKMGKFTPASFGFVVIGVLVLILLGTSVFIVDQAEQAVITRLGKFYTIKGPGLQFKLPFGIDRSYLVNVRLVQEEEFGSRPAVRGSTPVAAGQARESTMLTGDLNIIEVPWSIQYLIIDPRAWVFNVQERERTIRDVSRSVINMLVGDRTIMDIMSPERTAIEILGMDLMNETFELYGLGINVIAVKLGTAGPPAGVQQAFDDVNMAIQDMNRLINEGQQVYNEEIPRARGEAERIVQVAQGYAAERVNMARGNTARFLSVLDEYRRAPEVTRQRLYYEAMEEVFSNDENLTVIDRNLRNFLPMMSVGGVVGSGAAPTAPAAQGGR